MNHNAHPLPSDAQERLAQRRAQAKMGWLMHLVVYLLVNAVLIGLSLSQGRHWAVYPALGWGLGLVIHGAVVFMATGGSGLYERMVRAERTRLQREADSTATAHEPKH